MFGARKTKYGAQATTIDGIRFASKKEASRYLELKILLKSGEIRDLELQPEYEFLINNKLICKYRADFRYEEATKPQQPANVTLWRFVVEDVKGFKTPVYRLKKKMMLAWYGITIRET